MKKNEAEKALRHLCGVWRKETGQEAVNEQDLHFSDYYSWITESHSVYLTFRSVMPVSDVVERWFDEEFHQTWRN